MRSSLLTNEFEFFPSSSLSFIHDATFYRRMGEYNVINLVMRSSADIKFASLLSQIAKWDEQREADAFPHSLKP